MSKAPPPPRAKSATDVRRTLFRSLSRTGPSTLAGASSIPASAAAASAAEHADAAAAAAADAEAAAPEGIVVRRKDGSMDLEVPLTTTQHAQLLDGIGRELAEQQRVAAELVKRHQVDAYKKLPELLRLHVLSLAQDSWMFESDEEC